jgi:hypothetical protein
VSVGSSSPVRPAVAVSGNNVYVVWEDNSSPGNSDILYRRSTNGGASFGATINLSNSAGLSPFSSIAASGNNVYVVWRDDVSGSTEILYRRSTDGGANFEPAVNLSNNAAGLSNRPSVAVSANNVYVVWEDNAVGSNEILYRRSTDGGANFESTVNLSNNLGNSVLATIAASGNNVYVVWDDNPSGPEILYRRSTDGGANFESTVNLSKSPGPIVTSGSVAVLGNNVYVVWTDTDPVLGNNEIFYRRSTDGGANFESTVSNLSKNNGNSFDAHIAVS